MATGTSQTIGTKFVNTATTTEKVRTLARKNPDLGKYLSQTFGVAMGGAESTAGTLNGGSKQLDRYTRNVIQTLFSAEVSLNSQVGQTTNGIAGGISQLGENIQHDLVGLKTDLNELLKPVSSAVGSTLGNLTNVLRDPLGAPQAIGNSLMSVIDRISPDFANQLDGSVKKFKLDELQNLPGQMLGSVRNLATAADELLSVPFGMISDLYNGLMDIMKEIGNLVDSLMSSVFDFFFGPKGVLDSIFPIGEILSLLEEVGEIMSFADSIVGQFGGFSAVTNITSQFQGYVSQATSILQNPAQLAQAYLPAQVTEGLGMLRNPEQMLQSLIPPEIGSQLQKIGQIPGLGFVGNMGYGLGGALKSLEGGVFSQALAGLEQQAGILGPLFNKQNGGSPVVNQSTPYPPGIEFASTNPNIQTIKGVPVKTSPPPVVLQTK